MIDLKAAYDEHNRKIWGNRLPREVVVEWSDKLPASYMEGTYVHGMSKNWPRGCGRQPKIHTIRIRPEVSRWECVVHMTLLHAMVHMEASLGDKRLLNHGPTFHHKMFILANHRFFNPYW